jgi:hypothetical protein
MSTSKKKPMTKKPVIKEPGSNPSINVVDNDPVKKIEEDRTAELLKKLEALEKRAEEQQKVIELMKQEKEKEEKPVEKMSDDELMEQMRLRDRQLIPGVFKFHDVKEGSGNLKFTFKKWRNDPIETFLLVDGQRYALPKGVVDHLNDDCKFICHPGNAEMGRRARRKPVIVSRTSFLREDYDKSIDVSTLDKGYAPKVSM